MVTTCHRIERLAVQTLVIICLLVAHFPGWWTEVQVATCCALSAMSLSMACARAGKDPAFDAAASDMGPESADDPPKRKRIGWGQGLARLKSLDPRQSGMCTSQVLQHQHYHGVVPNFALSTWSLSGSSGRVVHGLEHDECDLAPCHAT